MMQVMLRQAMGELAKMSPADFEAGAADLEPRLTNEQFMALVRVMNRGLNRRFPPTPPHLLRPTEPAPGQMPLAA